MNYSFTLLTSKEDCNALLSIALKDKKQLVLRQANLESKKEHSSENAVGLETEMQSVTAEISSLEAIIAGLPEGENKKDLVVRKTKAEFKKFILSERKNNYGAIALLETEYDIGCVEKQIEETDAFITAINNRIKDF
jgi:hypothetical protein